MRVYTLTNAELNASGFGSVRRSGLRFSADACELVADPHEADAIICPLDLAALPTIFDLARVPHYIGNLRQRFVFFHVSDDPDAAAIARGDFCYVGEPAMFLRCNLRRFQLAQTPNAIPMAWPVGKIDLDAVADGPREFTHDVGFHAWLSSDVRKAAFTNLEATGKSSLLKIDIAGYPDFYGYLFRADGTPKPEAVRRRAEFLNSMRRCRLQVCPWSIPGVYAYRCFETMCAGRVAVIFVDGEVKPWTGLAEIPWDEFCFHFPGAEATHAGEICAEILATHSDEVLTEMGKRARRCFLTMLDDRRWPELHMKAVEASLHKRGLLR